MGRSRKAKAFVGGMGRARGKCIVDLEGSPFEPPADVAVTLGT
jgi:hypothetical protein